MNYSRYNTPSLCLLHTDSATAVTAAGTATAVTV